MKRKFNKPMSELERLAMQRRNEELKAMGEALSVVSASGMTLLHFAAKYDNLEILTHAMHVVGFDVNVRTASGLTPLALAARHGANEAAKLLLRSDADIFDASTAEVVMSQAGRLPTSVLEEIAASYERSHLDREAKVKTLVQAGCSLAFVLTLGDWQATNAFFAKTSRRVRFHEWLGALSFSMQRLDPENVRCLMEYMHRGDRHFLDLLGGFVRSTYYRHSETAELFLQLSVEWDIVGRDLVSRFEDMFLDAQAEAVQLLLDCDIDVHIRSKFGIEAAIQLFGNPNVDAVELLKDRSLAVNARSTAGSTALLWAVQMHSEKAARFLLDKGADPNARDRVGMTPFWCDIVRGGGKLYRCLLQYGADVQFGNRAERVLGPIHPGDRRDEDYLSAAVAQLVLDAARGKTIETSFRDRMQSDCSVAFKGCTKQVEELREHELSNSVTLFFVLTAKPEDVARRLRDEDCSAKLEDYSRKRRLHPYYESTLQFKLLRASKVYSSMLNLAEIVSRMTGISVGFDHLVVEKVFSYLSYFDMLQLA